MPERFEVERKGALSLWTAKTCDIFKDGSVAVYDLGADKSSIKRLAVVSHAIGDDPLVLILQSRGEDVTIRFSSTEERVRFTEVLQKGLSTRSKILQLPPVDPRNGIPFIDVPQAYVAKFGDLERAVLYWFAPITKYGAPSAFSRSYSTEDRMAFCSDTAFYITKPNSEVTRCLRISLIEEVVTNESADSGEPFLGIRMQRPDYDVLLSGPTVDSLLTCILRLYKYSQMGKAIDISHCKSVADVPADKLMLKRPGGYSMKLMVPTQRDKLRKALDEFGKKNNLKFTEEGVVVSPKQVSATPPGGAGKASSPSVTRVTSPPTNAVNAGTNAKPSTSKAAATTSSSNSGATQNNQNNDTDEEIPIEVRENPLFVLLSSVRCANYFQLLSTQNVDIDILDCMDETDLRTYGITDSTHVTNILAAIAARQQSMTTSNRASTSPEAKQMQQHSPPPPGSSSSQPTNGAPGLVSPSQPLPPATRVSVPITLSDSDDDDDGESEDEFDIPVAIPQRGTAGAAGGGNGAFTAAAGGMKIVLSSDDDDDEVVAPPAAKKPAVVLDEDDL